MSTTTAIYNFNKPGQDDFYNIDDQNVNWDKAEEALKAIDSKIENIQFPVTSVNNKNGDITLTASDIKRVTDGKTIETTLADILTLLGKKLELLDVQSEIQKVIGTAPTALNTLQELAAAINNDANFAATITSALANKVDKVAGKQLSTEDFTTALKTKLDSLINYIHPTGDGNLHVPATSTTNNGKFLKAGATAGSITWSAVTIADISNLQTTLNSKANLTDVYSKSEIDTKLSGLAISGSVYTKTEIDTKLATKTRVIVSSTEDTTADFWFQEV